MIRRRNDDESDIGIAALSVRSWTDIGSIAALVVSMLAGVAWGLKLEERYDSLLVDYKDLKSIVDKGILPIAEERVIRLTRDVSKLQEDHETIRIQVEQTKLEIARVRLGNVEISPKRSR